MLQKFLILQKEYASTTTLRGSSFLFFFSFWTTKVLSSLQQHNETLNRIIHRIVRHFPYLEFIIKNKSGIFAVQPFDDSTTICSDYFEEHLRPWLALPPQKDVFLDIGANRGLYTVLALTKYGFREVRAFEPNPKVCTTLEKNITLNDITDRVTVHPVGLGKEDAMLGFVVDEMHLGGGRVAEQDIATLKISVKALDAVIDEVTAARINFIKIDTEGYERAVLEGASRTLTQMPNSSCVMIESTDPDTIATILAPYGFTKQASFAHDHLFIKHAHDLHT